MHPKNKESWFQLNFICIFPMSLPLTGLYKLHEEKKIDKKKNYKSPGKQIHGHLNTSTYMETNSKKKKKKITKSGHLNSYNALINSLPTNDAYTRHKSIFR